MANITAEAPTRPKNTRKPAKAAEAQEWQDDALAPQAGAKPYRDRPTPPIRRIDPEPASGDSPYALACAWSEKTNQVFNKLQDAEQLLQAEAPDSSALAIIKSVLGQIQSIDEEEALLNVLAKKESSEPPATNPAAGQLTRAQLLAFVETMAGSLGTLNQTLMMAQTAEAEWQREQLLDAGQLMAQSLGAMTDHMAGSDINGSIGRWMCGPSFDEMGRNAA